MGPRDWTLVAIAAANGEHLSPVQLQKCLFLIGENCKGALGRGFYQFIPYNYGPFNATIYSDAEKLEAEGLVTVIRRPGQRWVEYAATLRGIERARALEKGMPKEVVDYLHNLVAWARRQTFEQLLRAIYKHYPHYRRNRVFQD